MNTYTWQIKNLEYVKSDNGHPNVVTNIHWKLIGSDGTHSAEVSGIQFVAFDEKKPFVQYEDLTEQKTIEWLISTLGEEQVDKFKASIDAEIETQVNPVSGRGLPWN
jgi:hypothetical protein